MGRSSRLSLSDLTPTPSFALSTSAIEAVFVKSPPCFLQFVFAEE